MRTSLTLSRYLACQYLSAFLGLLGAILAVIFLADVIELLRRVAGKAEIPLSVVFEMALLKLPFMGQQAFPFVGLFATMAVFWRLSRSHELTVVRAAGISAWQFLLAPVVLAILLGLFQTMLFNPVASTLLSRFDRLEAVMIDRKDSTLSLSATGLWLRQKGADGQEVVHAGRVDQIGQNVELRDVTVFQYQGADKFQRRLDAPSARLEPGGWRMKDVWIFVPEQPATHVAQYVLPTELTFARIEESFAKPETISFWQLPGFIRMLEASGFSAVSHRLHFQGLLAAPLLMVAMVFIGATFTLRHARKGGTVLVIAGGALSGFALHFLSDLVFAFGLSDRVPVVLAAWTPATAACLLGLALLLHFEDG